MSFRRYVLASRSAQRLELLRQIVHPELIVVKPPESADEQGFRDCHTIAEIHSRLSAIAGFKAEQVQAALNKEEISLYERPRTLIIAADTTLIAEIDGGTPVVLGQPPDVADWREVVSEWFRRYYAGRTHVAATVVCVVTPEGRSTAKLLETQVTFRKDVDRWLNWYLLTGESRGKAGGYALQGAGSIFIDKVEGSLSNVIGLPLEALLELFADVDLDQPATRSHDEPL